MQERERERERERAQYDEIKEANVFPFKDSPVDLSVTETIKFEPPRGKTNNVVSEQV